MGRNTRKEVCAKHRRLQKKKRLIGATGLAPVNQRRYELSSFSLYSSRAFTNTAGGGQSRRKKYFEKKRKKKKGTHLPLGDDFALPLHYCDELPPKRRSPPRQRVRVDIFWQSTCRNVHGVSPARAGRISFFSGRGCGERGGRVLLGDGAIERGSVVIDTDGHVGLGFRHDHSRSMLNLKSD